MFVSTEVVAFTVGEVSKVGEDGSTMEYDGTEANYGRGGGRARVLKILDRDGAHGLECVPLR